MRLRLPRVLARFGRKPAPAEPPEPPPPEPITPQPAPTALHRIAVALHRRDWISVLVETLIVTFGVLLGLQLNNWNESRVEREHAREYISSIRADLVADMTELTRHQDFWQQVADEGYTAIHFAETGEANGATDWEILRAFLNASQAWQFTFIDTTYSELRSSGELKLIPDKDLKSALADYYVLVAARRGGLGPYNLLPAYREMVRGRMRSDIMRYYWQACFKQDAGVQIFVDCPPPEDVTDIADLLRQLAEDQALIDALRYWTDTEVMAVQLAGFDLARAQTIIDLTDEMK
ncbi:MAG: hypothetical protein R3B98_08335 [Hyphomonas sp.]|nr:hypothetical protein [Hyphomonas sp.]MCC0017547.1 hypothetical protein [Rhodobiaceae bacterium]